MKRFARLVADLRQARSSKQKTALLSRYLDDADDADKLWALALLLHKNPRRQLTNARLKEWSGRLTDCPEWLIEESLQVVGNIAETIALLLPDKEGKPPQSLAYWIGYIKKNEDLGNEEKIESIKNALLQLDNEEQYVFLQLLSGTLTAGLSNNIVFTALAQHSGIKKTIIAHRFSSKWLPDNSSFSDLVLKKNDTDVICVPYPLLHTTDLKTPPETLGQPEGWLAEWLVDGIRAQVIVRKETLFLWSEEELITEKFPELAPLSEALPDGTVVDGKLVAFNDNKPLNTSAILARLRRKNQTAKQLRENRAHIVAYDLLEWQGKDIRSRSLAERRKLLEYLCESLRLSAWLNISSKVDFSAWEVLDEKRTMIRHNHAEGLLLRHSTSKYITSDDNNKWHTWKPEPLVISSVLLYAQKNPAHGTDHYSEFTIAVWKDTVLIPIARTQALIPEDQLRKVDQFVKENITERFGPVRTVKPGIVFEVAFDGIQPSTRRKSGLELLYPRIIRWCSDKKPEDAHTLADLKNLFSIDE